MVKHKWELGDVYVHGGDLYLIGSNGNGRRSLIIKSTGSLIQVEYDWFRTSEVVFLFNIRGTMKKLYELAEEQRDEMRHMRS